MYLEAQVASSHCIKEVKSDREVLAETCLYSLSEKLCRFPEHEVHRWDFEESAFDFKKEAVLLRNAVEAPSEVLSLPVKVADFLHPLASPWSRVEERNYSERIDSSLFQTCQECCPVNHLRCAGNVGVDPVFNLAHDLILVAVADSPVVEITSLVLERRCLAAVVSAECLHLMPAESLLDLPSCHVSICQKGVFICDKRSSGAYDCPIPA